jgi:hypothetical protein
MDPYLEDEKLWPDFQHQLVMCLYQTLLPGLVDRYRARVGQRHYVTEQALFTSIVRDEHHEEFIEVRQRTDGRLVTLIDVVSPANKTLSAARKATSARRPRAPAPASSRSISSCKDSRPWNTRATACPTGTTPSP